METKVFLTNEEDIGKRLDVFIQQKMPEISRSHIKNLIEKQKILVDKKQVKAGLSLKSGMTVQMQDFEPEKISAQADESVKFEIVYQDEDLAVINKPQGLVVHPCSSTKNGTLVNGLLAKLTDLSGINGALRPGIVHRLDKDTSGLLIVAKNDFAHTKLVQQIKDKTCHRNYLALLDGNLKEDEGRVETYLNRDPKDRKKIAVSKEGRLAITDFKVLKRFSKTCLVEFSLQTGRTHQIRVHSKFLGHPIVGDKTYGKEVKALAGQLLHAYKISFVHPRTNKEMSFEADLPDYFEEYLKKQK